MAMYFSKATGVPNGKFNIIPGYVEPSDMSEIKRVVKEMGIKPILFPDTSNVLNGAQTGKYKMYPDGGVTKEDLTSTGDSIGTIALGETASADAARALDVKWKVPCQVQDLPIGLFATDRFIDALRKAAGVTVPDSITLERGQLLDIITDMQAYFYHKKVALAGDPDHLIPLVEFLIDIDMMPVHIVTGTPGKAFLQRIEELTADLPYKVNVKAGTGADMYLLHQWIKNEPVDLLIANTYGKYMAKDDDIPFVRYGFPITDRVGHSYFPTVCYKGGMRLLEKILDVLLERIDRDAPEESFELVM
jgi:nitrogenase molybdenum-iron protein beta chain